MIQVQALQDHVIAAMLDDKQRYAPPFSSTKTLAKNNGTHGYICLLYCFSQHAHLSVNSNATGTKKYMFVL